MKRILLLTMILVVVLIFSTLVQNQVIARGQTADRIEISTQQEIAAAVTVQSDTAKLMEFVSLGSTASTR